MPRALLSVTNKAGLVDLANGLVARGFELIATGGTAKLLRESGLDLLDVSDVTGFPEILDGRVKTLHPAIHSGLLADRSKAEHVATLETHGLTGIDVLAVNLYAFEETVSGAHSLPDAIESIDIGGPAMVRAAAKNHAHVLVLTDPAQYGDALGQWDAGVTAEFRLELAAAAFAHTAYYDSLVSRYLLGRAGAEPLRPTLTMGYRRVQAMRYGENPHQSAALYADPLAAPGIAQAEQLWGKELSYNNVLDADGAWGLVNDLPRGACAVIKHGNPCGAALAETGAESYRLARASDPISAFGGIVAFHGTVDESVAEAMTEAGNFLEVVIAEGFTDGGLEVFRERSGWGKNVRLLRAPLLGNGVRQSVRSVSGGALVQDVDRSSVLGGDVRTHRQPTDAEWRALEMAWRIVAHVKSNAIVVADAQKLLGVGAGQMNRVQSVRLALEQAGAAAAGAALASDAFFPFPDSIETAAAAGVKVVVQPGGSKKDDDVIAAADAHGMAMVFTGTRHFRH